MNVDWPTLRDWCLAHGAKNDRINRIEIDGRLNEYVVVLEGYELNDDGKPYSQSLGTTAMWRSTHPLQSFPS